MRKYLISIFFGLFLAGTVGAATVSYFGNGATDQLGVVQVNLLKGEDATNNVMRVEQQFSGANCKAVTADTQCKSSAGMVHTVTISQTSSAAPTAGVMTLYDNTAESGTVIWSGYFSTSVQLPVTITLDYPSTTGLYLGYDATLAGIKTSVTYR